MSRGSQDPRFEIRRAGFVERDSDVYLSARCPDRADVALEESWQLLPGDSDAL